VSPGLHVPRDGSHRVVWWDPATLDLGREPDVDQRREQVLLPNSPESARDGAEAYAAWEAKRTETLQRGGAPSAVVWTVRDAAARTPVVPGFNVQVVEGRRPQRPSGPRFGALVHAALARVPLDAAVDGIRAVVDAQARLLGATGEESVEAHAVVALALKHPVWTRARGCAPEELRREVPLMVRRPDGTLIEGVVDLAYRTGTNGTARWTVVEIKTDSADAAGVPPEHHAQLGLYVEAISAATGEPADGLIALV
jgi:hypothetical protein